MATEVGKYERTKAYEKGTKATKESIIHGIGIIHGRGYALRLWSGT